MLAKLAQANGLSAGSSLAAGQALVVPSGVIRNGDNASLTKPYNPADAYGDTSPTTPQPQAAPGSHGGCGILGQILLVAIAVAVTAIAGLAIIGTVATTAGVGGATATAVATGLTAALGGTAAAAGSAAAIGAGVIGGALAGAAGSIVSQGFGIATGIQDKFSWKDVALAGISGGVGGGLGQAGVLSGASGVLGHVQDVVRGALGSAITQGVSIATGLEHKFDWAAVAVGGVVGGTIGAIHLPGIEGRVVSGLAGAITGGAARSLIDGSDFGGNVLAALPDVIGNTIGSFVAGAVTRTANFNKQVSALERAGISNDDAKSYVRSLGKLQRGDISGFLDQGGAGGSGITAHTDAEDRAYAAALAQTGKVTDAQTAVLATALREKLDLDAGRIGASDLSAKVKDGFFQFKGAIDQALISTEVYFDRSIPEMLPQGYSRLSSDQVRGLGFDPAKLVDTTSGYFAALYAAPGGKYVYANRGTDNGPDWNSSIRQGLGEVSPQYKRAIDNARELSNTLGGRLSFTGHSLGGGLATAQALVTNLHATVFDPAGVNPATLKRYGADFSHANQLVTSYYVQGEFLHGLNATTGVPTQGRVIALPVVEPLSRDQNDFYSAPTSNLNGIDSFARHATSELLSSMFYKYAKTRAWP